MKITEKQSIKESRSDDGFVNPAWSAAECWVLDKLTMRKIITIFFIFVAAMANADNWEHVIASGDYYYGIGIAPTQEEADNAALVELSGMIATRVSSEFRQLDDISMVNGSLDHKTKVEMCLKTYTYSSLREVKHMVRKEKGDVVVLRYMLRSELDKIYEGRKEIIASLVASGDNMLEDAYIDQALKNYYWAYMLIRSLQEPEKLKDSNGAILSHTLRDKIERVLSDIEVTYSGRDGDRANLLFSYKGKPVQSLVFTFNNGTEQEHDNMAKNGRGMIVMRKGHENGPFHIDIEYQFHHLAERDDEMKGVLDVVSAYPYGAAHKVVTVDNVAKPMQEQEAGVHLKPSVTQVSDDKPACVAVMERVTKAIASGSELQAATVFTPAGKRIYDRLLGYGREGRIVGTPDLQYFQGYDSTTVVRGMQMSFVTRIGGKNRTFVEDVVFTLDRTGKVSNVAFGLGEKATIDILCRSNQWPEDAKELLTEFMENYKTAYCLERLDYLQSIFSDDAVIIVGNVLRPRTQPVIGERPISISGEEKISYNRYTKDQYMKNLKRCFDNNEFINIQFGNNDVQWLEKLHREYGEEVYAINIRQEYVSTTYSDKGYLFLMIDMTNRKEPLIRVRTWQPNEVPLDKLYNAGDFFRY